jgi:hypothetical protein
MKARLLVFSAMQICFAFIAWCGGYDFNERSGTVAYFVGLALVVGLIGAGFPGLGNKT